jgi:hypothetical protein
MMLLVQPLEAADRTVGQLRAAAAGTVSTRTATNPLPQQ